MSDTTASSNVISSNTLNSIPTAQLGGKKKKNGYKATCGCPICKNMKKSKRGGQDNNDKVEMEQNIYSIMQNTGGSKRKKNGHKISCDCPICVNMKHAKHGGDYSDDDEDDSSEEDEELEVSKGGSKKKKNGHKMSCGCPICNNMKRSKRGGDDTVDSSVEQKPTKVSNMSVAKDDEYNDIDEIPENKTPITGGSRKYKKRVKTAKRKRNFHKKSCKCPICKNMKKCTKKRY